ncbi:MAG: hypothetical protein HFH35_04660 [Eubacterium sp.]|nr:hypothetical protein [Eubacterium sp.]
MFDTPDHMLPSAPDLQTASNEEAQAVHDANEEQIRIEHARYARLFQSLVQEEEQFHKENQKRIQAGLQCLFWIPLLFLALLFLTESEKVIFLLLWIVSLFILAAYLIYIEYMDFLSQERLRRYTADETVSYSALIGEDMEAIEETVVELLRQIDERKASSRRKMLRLLGKQLDAKIPVRKETDHE